MEHDVYVCGWKQTADRVVLWIADQPEIRAEGETYALAEERLLEAIAQAGGAMHAVLEFNPPLPPFDVESKYTTPTLYLIGGDDRFEADGPKPTPFESTDAREKRFRWADQYYESPICRACRFATGKRNSRPISVTYAPRKFDGAFGSIGDCRTTHQILSEKFVDLLTEQERARLQLRAVTGNTRLRTFYELVGPAGPKFVAVSGMRISGWRCTVCPHRIWSYWIEDMAVRFFIAKSDLPPDAPGVFTVGKPPEIELVATAARWSEIVGNKGTRGVTSRPLGVVPDHEVVRMPDLPARAESTGNAS